MIDKFAVKSLTGGKIEGNTKPDINHKQSHTASWPQKRVGMKLLLIEDDERTAEFILRGLKEHSHVADDLVQNPNQLKAASKHSRTPQ